MTIISMEHDDTGEVIDVELGNKRWIAKKIIQDHELLGYRILDMDIMEIHHLLATLGRDDRQEVQKYYD